MASSLEGQLAAKLAAGTLGKLGIHQHGDHCEVDLSIQAMGKVFDYVCDTTVPWMHFVKDTSGSHWALATPPPGSGCHSYVFLTGAVPDGCQVGQACAACGSPPGVVVSTVKFQGGTCKSCT